MKGKDGEEEMGGRLNVETIRSEEINSQLSSPPCVHGSISFLSG